MTISKNCYWGIDLGGTKIELAIIDPSELGAQSSLDDITKATIFRERVPTESAKGYQAIVSNICKLVNSASEKFDISPQCIGIGTPGIIDPDTSVTKNSNTQCLNGQAINLDLENTLKCKIKIANDANCFALAEHLFGASKGSNNSFGVIMGTGVGGGVIINNKIHAGSQGIGGEWGHINTDLTYATTCYCGNNGCVEQIISGPALERFYEQESGVKLKLSEISTRASENRDPAATKTIDRLNYFFGKSLASVVNILDPEIIVLGGGVSNVEQLYTGGLETLKKYVFNNKLSTQVKKNILGDSAGVFGAALLSKPEY